eukprot:TRINITY_DN51437_c0_g1_i1.p1 TRINITY_DN51437_c0_g1~~TRINITY_DN51437_c0_g1_i1.p1  ORF type:complete len:213 (-),score=44.14 TRINITY_DN51437_c0_g1_i1:240-878(-)
MCIRDRYQRRVHGAHRKNSSPLVQKIKLSMDKGLLINSDIIIEVMRQKLIEEERTQCKGIIFDGCPRIKVEAEALLDMGEVSAAIHFDSNTDVLVEKLMGRRECRRCHKTYNVAHICRDGYQLDPFLPSKNPERCDSCNEPLVRRSDDNPEAISLRLQEYATKTFPMINDIYMKQQFLRTIIMYRGLKEYPAILDMSIESLKQAGFKYNKQI